MIIRAIGIFHKKGRKDAGGTLTGWLLVTAVAVSLIFVGSLVWINNSTAVIPDNDPTTFVQLELIDGIEGNEGVDLKIQAADHGAKDPIKNQIVVCGNGDQDDNRERPLAFQRVESEMVSVAWIPAVTSFADRRTVAAYWYYGHLRIIAESMPKNLNEG